MPAVTIGICVRNSQKIIQDTARSIADQTYPKGSMEIIFVDDGSTDRTLEMIHDFSSTTEIRTKIFHQSWKGLGVARNVVFNNATGRYIIWVDGGMTFEKEFVSKQVKFMDQNPKVGASKGFYGLSENTNIVVRFENFRSVVVRKNNQRFFGTGGSIYRVQALKEAGGFDEGITGAGEDVDALSRIVSNGWDLSANNAVFFEKYKQGFRDLWRQNYWYGYGAHYVRHKNKRAVSYVERIPPIAFLLGIRRFFVVFKLDPKVIYVLLPVYQVFRDAAWCVGFTLSHIRNFGHKRHTVVSLTNTRAPC